MKRISDCGETAVLVPPVLSPVQVQVAIRTVPVQIGHIAVAIRVAPDRNVQNII